MTLLHETEGQGNSGLGHPLHRGCDSFDCCKERYEIVVLLPNSELTKGNNVIISTMLMDVRFFYEQRPWGGGGGGALKIPYNFIVCGQKHKVWVLNILVRMSRTL